jgi:serine/threonine-protein kinase
MKPNQHSQEDTGPVENCIGSYKLIGEIAPDGAGRVFEAVEPLDKKRVAIKHLPCEADRRDEIETALFSAAETLASLSHPHIAKFLGLVRQKDQLYLVTEFVEGESLQTLLKRKGRLEPSAALAIFREVSSAVGFAHGRAVIHGDVRPSQIMLTKAGMTKVLNFAVGPILPGNTCDPSRDRNVTYRAPEQSGSGDSPDARSDVYSLGVLLYEMIVGYAPFRGMSAAETICAKAEITPLRPSMLASEIPDWLDAFLMRALAPSPCNRFESVEAMLQAISAQQASPSGAVWSARAVTIRAFYRQLSSAAVSMTFTARRWLASLPARVSRRPSIPYAVRLRRFGAMRRPLFSLAATRDQLNRRVRGLPLRLSSLAGRKIQSSKEALAAARESGWKRHAVLALLLGAVMIEIFFFAGANTLLRPAGMQAAGGYDNAVDQLFARMDGLSGDDKGRAAVGNAKVLETPAARQSAHVPQKSAISDAPPPPAAGKITTDRPRRLANARIAPEEPFHRPSLQEPSRQPLASKAPVERHSPKIQLNVQWEN